MQNMNEVYRNTCCMCCGIPQVSKQYFKKLDGTLVRYTVDHVLLRSLGGSNHMDNLVPMCYDCNQVRSNHFAELQEFLDWYWSGEDLPVLKNFSYLKDKPSFKSSPSRKKINSTQYNDIPVLGKKEKSVSGTVIYLKGIAYQEYKHPVYGTSLVRIKDTDNVKIAC